MKGLVVCNSLDHFPPGVTRRRHVPFYPSSTHIPHHPQEREKEVSFGGRKGREQDGGVNVHPRGPVNSGTNKLVQK